jgi:nitrogen-specific signal transduction histidine kinase
MRHGSGGFNGGAAKDLKEKISKPISGESFMQADPFTEKNRKPPLLKIVDENAECAQSEDDFFGSEKEENLFDPFPKKAGLDPAASREKNSPGNQDDPFVSTFLVELIHAIKSSLISIKKTSTLSTDRCDDAEFRKIAQKSITEDVKQIDSVLNSLLNYIHINTPIVKSNTISMILEEVLEANEKQTLSKRIKIFKKCEKDLPETFIHDEQVRFILNSILQYAILSTPPGGTIGFLIKSFDFHNGEPGKQVSPERNGGHIEAAIGFMGDKEPSDPLKNIQGNPPAQKEEATKLILQLVKEILQKNHGGMTCEVDPKKPRTLITLRLPIERRKVVYYEPISI